MRGCAGVHRRSAVVRVLRGGEAHFVDCEWVGDGEFGRC